MAERQVVVVASKALPLTALNSFGGEAADSGCSITVFVGPGSSRPAGLDPRIDVRTMRPRGRTRVTSKARALALRAASDGVRGRTAALALADADVLRAARRADVLVALDLDAALAVWMLSRLSRSPRAVLGLPELVRLAAEETAG